MAWLTQARSNRELCDKLISLEMMNRGSDIEQAFSAVDRGDFVSNNLRTQCYDDSPIKEGYIHLSAPHMYVKVINSLEIERGNSILNMGSGTGYLSCIMAFLLKGFGFVHGVELSKLAYEQSLINIDKWKTKSKISHNTVIHDEMITVTNGNCFDIDINWSINHCMYDRIYIGAACPNEKLSLFKSLLRQGGMLVAPVDETCELIRIKREIGDIFVETVLSAVRFAPLISSVEERYHKTVLLPKILYQAHNIGHYPESYRACAKALLFGRFQYMRFPGHLWNEILSFTTKEWFEPIHDQAAKLRLECDEERRIRLELEVKLRDCQRKRAAAEQERDIFRAMLYQFRYQRQRYHPDGQHDNQLPIYHDHDHSDPYHSPNSSETEEYSYQNNDQDDDSNAEDEEDIIV